MSSGQGKGKGVGGRQVPGWDPVSDDEKKPVSKNRKKKKGKQKAEISTQGQASPAATSVSAAASSTASGSTQQHRPATSGSSTEPPAVAESSSQAQRTQSSSDEPTTAHEAPEDTQTKDAPRKREDKPPRTEPLINAELPPFTKSEIGSNIVPIRTNFFGMTIHAKQLFRYSIDFSGAKIGEREIKNRRVKADLIGKLLKKSPFRDVEDHLATDWNSLIVSTAAANDQEFASVDDQKCFSVPFTNQADRKEVQLQIRIKRLSDVPLDKIDRYINGAGNVDCSEEITALNILSRKYLGGPHSDYIATGNNRYFEKLTAAQEDTRNRGFQYRDMTKKGLHPREGYFYSVRLARDQILLNLNVAATAFYRRGPLWRFLEDYFSKRFCTSPGRDVLAKLRPLLRTLQVRYLYNPPDHKTDKNSFGQWLGPEEVVLKGRIRRINGFGESASLQHFDHELFGTISVQEYFNTRVLPRGEDENLYYPDLPVVNTGGQDKPTWIPLELLWIEPHQPLLCKLESDLTEIMIQFARRTPPRNAGLIEGRGIAALDPAALRQNCDLHIEEAMQDVHGRILDPPGLHYRSSRSHVPPVRKPEPKGSWNLRDLKFSDARSLNTLHVIRVTDTESPSNYESSYLASLANRISNCGMMFQQENRFRLVDVHNADHDGLQHGLNALSSHQLPGRPNLLLVIIPSKDPDQYASIKSWGDKVAGIPTVCIKDQNLQRSCNNAHYAANIALKLNIKLGGTNHTIYGSEGLGKLKEGDKCTTMVVGADCTHPSNMSTQHCPSIAALVASQDSDFTRYPGSMRLQKSKQEMIEDLAGMMCERLLAWEATHGALPANILFYRDGVSENQFTLIKKTKLPRIRENYKLAGEPGYSPKITLVVVGKRHNTRFYESKKMGDRERSQYVTASENFNMGLRVDDERIRMPYYFGFYLQSHCPGKSQGTARNGHYFVLENEMGLNTEELHDLTFKLCLVYARSTFAVSYVAPAYYADKLCDRGRCYLRDMLQGRVKDSGIKSGNASPTEEEVFTYAKKMYWQGTDSTRENPWHSSLDNIMFYL